jgi:ribosomal protein S27AE
MELACLLGIKMGRVLGIGIDDPITSIIIVVVVLIVVICLRLYMIRKPGKMKAKCRKCGAVFDASHSFSGVHFGPYKYLDCPACGKSSFMNAYSREELTWPQNQTKPQA